MIRRRREKPAADQGWSNKRPILAGWKARVAEPCVHRHEVPQRMVSYPSVFLFSYYTTTHIVPITLSITDPPIVLSILNFDPYLTAEG